MITASIFVPSQGRMVFGRDDGSIVIVPAVLSVILQFLDNGMTKGKTSSSSRRSFILASFLSITCTGHYTDCFTLT